MYCRIGLSLLLGFVLATTAFGQSYPSQNPNQPVQPRNPGFERRTPPSDARRPAQPQPGARQPAQQQPGAQQPAQQQPPPPPFVLTPQEQAYVDHILNLWEQRNKKIKTFDCRFKRWTYDSVFAQQNQAARRPDEPPQAKYVESGIIKFAQPDRGLFRVDTTEKNGKDVPIEPHRMEYWLCDGNAVYIYNAANQTVEENKLPPEYHGKAIANSPLPFMFGAEAQHLKERYYIRIITPPDVRGQVWLEAYPRHQQERANFHHAQFMITAQGMTPYALRIVEPNGQDYRVYQFYDIVVNDPLSFFRGDPFRPHTPKGWRLIPDQTQPPPAAAGRPPATGRR